ncbi:hypothetical protein KFK09_014977 [Dendrobium nobile]|uniref:Uncharacterized protein n=1 Tax=Dendrobium nobile TaxID=94219 RepID=A0A8T3B3J0_DENNO|nr:hypothetical protein KFK09_014977 [Dendrobium nobile]
MLLLLLCRIQHILTSKFTLQALKRMENPLKIITDSLYNLITKVQGVESFGEEKKRRKEQ